MNCELLHCDGEGKTLFQNVRIIYQSMHPKIAEDWTNNGKRFLCIKITYPCFYC